MKKFIYTFLILFITMTSQAQSFDIVPDRNGKNLYKGFITDSLLKKDTSCKWYGEAWDVFTPKENVVSTFKKYKDSVSFLIFMGTWCEDSHFIIPRFYKTLEAAGFDKNKVTLIAVDRNKKDITNLATSLNITNVPTIIVLKDGKETGRVKEYGNTGKYDQEVADIITQAK